ncbi:hypothetical protein GCM10010172_20870 [Paractinoplanes ferrugineus]|uniref:Uncharacterized protein n=1 Tax=Paractinoplanes ferrugineus TaxID=113564 RepID=A0A919MID1_9ACTN|nr:hypothetical protein [Actinoplanes ferrugineus]GIE09002.1 hypothetical protein Afe05nite_08420 [Actinoplanes ferrugineus]
MIEDVCATELNSAVDVDQVAVLRQRKRPPTIPEIIEQVEENADTFHLVFVHRDQDGNTERVNQYFRGVGAG